MSEPRYVAMYGPHGTTKWTFRLVSEDLVRKMLAHVESRGKTATVLGLPSCAAWAVDEALASQGVRVVRYFDVEWSDYLTLAMTMMVDKP